MGAEYNKLRRNNTTLKAAVHSGKRRISEGSSSNLSELAAFLLALQKFVKC